MNLKYHDLYFLMAVTKDQEDEEDKYFWKK